MTDVLDVFNDLFEKAKAAKDPTAFAEVLLSAPYRDDADATASLLDAYSEYSDMISHYIIGLAGALVVENPSEEEFYQRLRSGVFGDGLIGENQKKCAFLLASINNQIPYRRLDIISMEQEEFSRRSSNLMPEIESIFELAVRPFNQKTEKASSFLKVIESKDDERDRAILMSATMDAVKSSLMNQGN